MPEIQPETESEPEQGPDHKVELEEQPRRSIPIWILPIAAAVIGIAIGAVIVAGITDPEIKTVTETVTETVTIDPDEEDHFDLVAREGAVIMRELEADEREEELDARESELQEWENELKGIEEQVKANTVTEGIWTVGVDIEPGSYRATDVSSDCYWAILASGSNGSDIIENGIPGGGNPTVTLEEGQDFETSRCGEWVKQ
ncbi:hypothetical protein GCM10027447_20270 [Glycomyces halotolerans]